MEKEGDLVAAKKLEKEIQDRTSKCVEDLAQEEVRAAEETEEREKAVKRVHIRNEEDGAARHGESHRSEGGEGKKKETDWMELLEVTRVKDTGATEECREGRRAGGGFGAVRYVWQTKRKDNRRSGWTWRRLRWQDNKPAA